MKPTGMKQPPLQLEYYYFPEIKVLVRQGIPVEHVTPENVDFEFDLEPKIFQSVDDAMCYKVDLRVRTKDVKDKINPYNLDLLVSGFFRLDEKVPGEKREGTMLVLGPNILYGAARELLFQLTSRGPFPPLWLPTTSFVPDQPTTHTPSAGEALPAATKPKTARRKK
jgi:preprotein translocase subunit SecB